MLWLLPVVPLITAPLAMLAGGRASRAVLAAGSALVMIGVLALAIAAADADWRGAWLWSEHIRLAARLDAISKVMAMLVPAVALPVLLFAAAHERRQGLPRLVALLIAFVGAMELLVVADDLLTLLIGWELVGACSWALIAHEWQHSGPPKDAAAAFLITRFGDLGLFTAAMTTFAVTGSFDFAVMDTAVMEAPGLVVGGVLLAAAAKSAQLPFSLWLFNAMSGPSSVSALLHAATMVAAGAYLLARLHPVLDQVAWFGITTMILGLVTALAGGLVAILQAHVKKLLAASTSAQFGLMFVAVGAGYPGVAMLHLVVHAAFKSLLFMVAGLVASARYTHILALMNYGRRLPVITLLALVGSAALAGVPPFGAAWTKELIAAGATEHATWLGWGVLFAGAASAVYAARWQWLALGPGEFLRDKDTNGTGARAPAALAIPAVATAASAVLWLTPLHEVVGAWFGSALPQPDSWERAASLALLASGLYLGYWLASTDPHLGRRRRAAAAGNWLGLPTALNRGVVSPALQLATLAARFDDRVADRFVMTIASAAASLAASAARLDVRQLDAAIRGLAGLAAWSAERTARIGEALVDGAVEGLARITASAGTDTAGLQTGLAHQYLAWVSVGAAALAALVLLAS